MWSFSQMCDSTAFFCERSLSWCIVPQISRMQALGSIDGAPEGKPFYMDSVGFAVTVTRSMLMRYSNRCTTIKVCLWPDTGSTD